MQTKLVNPLSANIRKWSNILKRFVGKLPTNCLSVLDHFVEFFLYFRIAMRTATFSDNKKKRNVSPIHEKDDRQIVNI